MHAHIKAEAHKVADDITKERGNRKTLKSRQDKQLRANVDEDSVRCIMRNEAMHAHLKQEEDKMADLMTTESGNQRTSKYKTDWRTPTKSKKQIFWTLMEDEATLAHVRQEAFQVADMISRFWGSRLGTAEAERPAEVYVPQPSFTSPPPPPPPPPPLPTTAKPSQPFQVRQSDEDKQRLWPMSNPKKHLDHIFKLLGSDDWQNKIDGLTCVQDLARNHQDTLKASLHEVCVGVIKEVQNLHCAVSCTAMATLGEMYAHLQTSMDDMVGETGCAVLLKVSKCNTLMQQQANLTLDAMVQNCSPGCSMKALLSAGLGHRSAAVRATAAQHLGQLCDILGATQTLTGSNKFTKHFLIALRKICVDAAVDVRRHGRDILGNLSTHRAFQTQWKEAVPEEDRRSLEGLTRKINTARETCGKGL